MTAHASATARVGGARWRAYAEVLKPERTFFNVMTATAGFLFASHWYIDWVLFAAALGGTTLLVLSGCAANNLTDRRVDAQMPRTQRRALVTGQLSATSVATLAAVLGVVGITLLVAYVNRLTALLGLVAYVDYVVLYAWSKRTTPHSTLIGTISGAAPLVAGYTAVTGRFDLTALLLGLTMLFWQMPHFYAIGVYRLEDYRAGRLPIWPVVHGVRSTQRWILGYTALYVLAVTALSVWGEAGLVFGLVVAGLGLYWLWRGLSGFRSVDPAKWARGMFGFSLHTLLVLSLVLALAPFLP